MVSHKDLTARQHPCQGIHACLLPWQNQGQARKLLCCINSGAVQEA